ncbi:hypothetical protein CQA53_04345 [Helicobacter didelphidarum]|uniref:Uncharacterized protein n=1 Tax=Helicobacter didelphidarum TaxID=2040648 RepID=A0A3D8IMW6_9HELI|nr:hypothetical protein [Helicobacter didelphidarum]RDU66246.1 hypothetical protein CQA53_04345 [Helicobacter didelphidarum]
MEHDLKPILTKHAKEVIQYLIGQNIHFSVQCQSSQVQFDPILPEEISKHFHPIIDFILAGFTFESIEIWEDEMSFEAGFGKDNFSSLVVIPFSSIIQISIPTNNNIMRDICVFMNTMNFLNLEIFDNLPSQLPDDFGVEEEDELMESSKRAILSNPENKFH